MKQATRTLDIIGTVWNAIVLLAAIIALILSIVFKNHAAEIVNNQKFVNVSVEQVLTSATILRRLSIIFIILTIIALVTVIIAANKLEAERRNVLFHIIITLSGVFSLNLFFLLGGMFGIVIEDNKENLE